MPIEEIGNERPNINPNLGPSDLTIGDAESFAVRGLGATSMILAADQLTTADQTNLRQLGQALINSPEIPAGDKAKLAAWLETLSRYPIVVRAGDGPVLNPVVPQHNPYDNPSIIAILAPLLSELGKIYSKIMLSSAKMETAMMEMTRTIAKNTKELTERAGEKRAEMYAQEAKSHTAAAITAGVSVGLGIGSMLYQGTRIRSMGKEGGEAAVAAARTERTRERAANPNLADLTPEEITNARLTGSQNATRGAQAALDTATRVADQAGQAATHTVDTYVAEAKKTIEEEASELEAIKGFLEKTVETISKGSDKQSQEIDSASRAWRDLQDLIKQLAARVGNSQRD